MSKPDKSSSKAGAGDKPKRRNPGIEVVNVYGSGPLPIGERRPKRAARPQPAEPEQANRGALSTSLEGKDREG